VLKNDNPLTTICNCIPNLLDMKIRLPRDI
jgi:hypothetical protein